jgi:hypothetical protein
MPPTADLNLLRLQHLDARRTPLVVRSIILMAGFCLLLIGLHAWSL